MLASHLRELEQDGIVHREVYDEVPPRVAYSPTPLGVSLNEAPAPLGRGAGNTYWVRARRRTAPAGSARRLDSDRHVRREAGKESGRVTRRNPRTPGDPLERT
ncbi:protein of unknown function; putative transcriptional ragulator (plasmid) [Streptantibioticus cattleyicolor NRRL 8057 = DSM 46488]|nr:protein of unknown function; putative transcriptional ragulator [Streptantibioticus cattleyicolor NRRL 8057 = DSM 46488]